ncbi:MAG: CPBP family intramembrane metalloprotease [Lachnospiraceae bacterium]|nr:CPBP family intramembrane metalloprotease [Lachnospiraceae bacterium]
MRKISYFFKSIVPCLILLLLQVIVLVPMEIVYAFRNIGDSEFNLNTILNLISSSSSDASFSQISNLIYGCLALLVFGCWYRRVFVSPFRDRRSNAYPRGFSFHTIMAILFLGIGLQYVTTLVVHVTSALRPDWLATYNSLMDTAGYSDVTPMLAVYSVILAPIVEELIFRGLTFRYARHALPFWAANVWQALLFGLIHGNFIQGIYAFVMGLFLGFICHRGRGIKYSIPVHFVFNIIGVWYSGLIELTTVLNFYIAVGAGLALTVFAVWLFYTDFTPAERTHKE